MEKTQCGSKSNAHPGATPGGRSGKHKRKSGSGGKPIKVVYISNPMRVSTDASGFRALVQELTGRHADPSKYTAGGGAVVDVGESSGGSPAGPQMGPAPSPGSTAESSDGAAAAASSHDVGAAAAATGYGYDDDDEEDSFPPQLIDNRYSVFSPPTFLYGSHNEF